MDIRDVAVWVVFALIGAVPVLLASRPPRNETRFWLDKRAGINWPRPLFGVPFLAVEVLCPVWPERVEPVVSGDHGL